MKILTTGAGGMIGRKLVERLAKDKTLSGHPIDSMTLVDVVNSSIPAGAPAKAIVTDFSEKGISMARACDFLPSASAPASAMRRHPASFPASWRTAKRPEAAMPVCDDLRHRFTSPRAAVEFFTHAAGIDTAPLGSRRSMTMPGASATRGDEIKALGKASGEGAVKLIRRS